MANPGNFFLQYSGHPSFAQLTEMEKDMLDFYGSSETPYLPGTFPVGSICVAPVMNKFYRVQVTEFCNDDVHYVVKFLDHGGYLCVPFRHLRQLKSNFASLPYQAFFGTLSGVAPLYDEIGWTLHAKIAVETIALHHDLATIVTHYNEHGVPCVRLYINHELHSLNLNETLVGLGYARSVRDH